MKKLISVLISLLFSATFLSAKTIEVTSGADSGTGTLRQAIIDANDGDEIVFADNVTSITLSIGITIEKNIRITGNATSKTTISADTGLRPDDINYYFGHFFIPTNIKVSFNNLILTNGYNKTSCGGAILAYGSLTIDNCSFIKNRSKLGGAIYCSGSNANLTVTNSIFQENYSDGSAGAIGTSVNATLGNCSFIKNTCSYFSYGGAIENSGAGDLNINNCVFKENQSNKGSAIANAAKCVITNSIFNKNKNHDNFGVIYNEGSLAVATLNVLNSTIANNGSIGLYVDDITSETSLQNNIFWGNTANDIQVKNGNNGAITASHNLIGASNTDLSGNGNLIGENPLFVNAVNGDYSLQAGSPAINAGNNTYLSSEITGDLSGEPRIIGNTVDMGAYEFQSVTASDKSISADTDKIPVAYYSVMGIKLQN
ncbi:MAG: hypothetical protein LBR81_06825, partial [Prevotellaceae bacterium]|nr:hypothetical protein [Prevotellaceae bacterium]